MKAVILVPARYPSSRFPGKPLAMLRGAKGESRSLIHRSWAAAKAVNGVSEIHILTDDSRIANAARDFGASVVMTSERPRNGTERCAEALDRIEADVVVNLQGDAPLTPPHYVEALLTAMEDRAVDVATPVLHTEPHHLAALQQDRAEKRVGATTAVFRDNGDALYFSKEIIPFADNLNGAESPVFHHVGVYAYRPAALKRYMGWNEGPLEKLEGLEQLRFLENGARMKCVEVDARGRVFWELNNPEDVARIEQVLSREATS